MKSHHATLRIPTNEQYAYIELELIDESIENIIQTYLTATSTYKRLAEQEKPPF